MHVNLKWMHRSAGRSSAVSDGEASAVAPSAVPREDTTLTDETSERDWVSADLQGFWLVMGAALLGTLLGGTAVWAGMASSQRARAPLMIVHAAPVAEAAPEEPPRGEGPIERLTAAIDPSREDLGPTATAVDRASGREPRGLEDAVAMTRESVVNLRVGGETSGAGVVFDADGLVFTNYHVVAAAVARGGFTRDTEAGSDARITARFDNGRELTAEIVVADRSEDLAVLALVPSREGERFAAARVGASSRLRVGQEVFAVGSPLGLENTVATGIVSAVGRTGVLANRELPVIQLDAAINLGNSGGPLFNLAGELVGITTARAKGGEGIGFAIPIDRVKAFLRALQEGSAARAGAIGLRMNARAPVAKALEGTDYEVGIVVDKVLEGPAKRGGVQVGDVMVELRGRRFDELDDTEQGRATLARRIAKNVRSLLPGEQLDVRVIRDGEPVEITLEAEAASSERQARLDATAVFGVELDDASDALVITGVDQDSRLARVLRGRNLQGWRIRRVLGREVTDVDDLAQVVDHLREWAGDGKARAVAVELDDPTGQRVFVPAFPINAL